MLKVVSRPRKVGNNSFANQVGLLLGCVISDLTE